MQARLIYGHGGERAFALVLDKGDEVVASVEAFAREHQLSAAQFTGLGALSRVTLGFFERERKDYRRIEMPEQVEVLVLNGIITLKPGGGHQVHPHIVVGKSDGSAWGGHLLSGRVWPTLEVIVTEAPAHLRRRHDPETGLTLIDPAASSGPA
jgi:predicted DNA-binding protein with PD1-like motif